MKLRMMASTRIMLDAMRRAGERLGADRVETRIDSPGEIQVKVWVPALAAIENAHTKFTKFGIERAIRRMLTQDFTLHIEWATSTPQHNAFAERMRERRNG